MDFFVSALGTPRRMNRAISQGLQAWQVFTLPLRDKQIGFGGIRVRGLGHEGLNLDAGAAQGFGIIRGRGQLVYEVSGGQHGPFDGAILDEAEADNDRPFDFQASAASLLSP